MSPYLLAHEVYHRDGEPWIPWVNVLDFHLQHGVVISDDEMFLVARKVPVDAPEHEHPSLIHFPDADAGCWHIWAFAGSMRRVLEVAASHGAKVATFQRHGNRLHWMSIDRCHLFHSGRARE